jgi:hypothetical protein
MEEEETVMEKLVRDGKVAVLYSPGFGAGWYSWNATNYGDELVFDPVLATYVDEGKIEEAQSYIAMRYPDAYAGGVEDLEIRWVPIGTRFTIEEYDGNESVQILENVDWMTA